MYWNEPDSLGGGGSKGKKRQRKGSATGICDRLLSQNMAFTNPDVHIPLVVIHRVTAAPRFYNWLDR